MTDEQIKRIYLEQTGFDLDASDAALLDFARALLSASKPAVPQESRYIVIGYGESDHPQAAFVNDREQLLDAVLGMIYMHPSNADAAFREAYRRDLADDDEWSNDGIWSTEFEIGGIVIYDLGASASPAAPAQSAEAVAGSPAYALRGLYKPAMEYFVDGKPVTPEEYIEWQAGIIEAVTKAKLPDPKYYGGSAEEGDQHEVRCAYVDGWNGCRASIIAAPQPSQPAQSAVQDERAKALRYDWIVEHCDIDYRGNLPEGFPDRDSAIDAAVSASPQATATQPAQTRALTIEQRAALVDVLRDWKVSAGNGSYYTTRAAIIDALLAAQPASGGDRG